MAIWLLALALVTGCGSEDETGGARERTAATEPEPPRPAPPPEPTVLPAVTPEPSPLQGADGFSIEVDANERATTVTVKNEGQATFQGHVVCHLVWVGPSSGAEVTPWRAVSAIDGCTAAPVPIPVHTWGGAMSPGWTFSWEIARDRATFCRGNAIDGMDPPAGRYRVSAAFRRQDGTVERTLWSQPFVRRDLERS
jgi:hypothetical protein